MKEPDLYNLVLISKGKETGIAKRRLVHDGSRLTKRLPEHPLNLSITVEFHIKRPLP